uniref:Uncharacterized protein n=1 Tax=Gouania willdenowi TaxID=441366 RepID=A0A8C5H134_GOUWI
MICIKQVYVIGWSDSCQKNDSLSLGTTTYTVSEGMASRLQGYCPLGAFHNLFEQCQNTQHQLLVKVTSEIYQYVVNVILSIFCEICIYRYCDIKWMV